MLTIRPVALLTDNVSVKFFESCESSLADKAAPVVRSSPEVLDKVVLVFYRKSAMFAGILSGGNVMAGRSSPFCFTATSCKILEEIVFT